jgi:hypothetical protein
MNIFLTCFAGFGGGLILGFLYFMGLVVEMSHLKFIAAPATVLNFRQAGFATSSAKTYIDFRYLSPSGEYINGHEEFRSVGCLGRAFTPGQNITVYVNPLNPKEAVLDHGVTWQTLVTFICMLAMTLLCGGYVLKSIFRFLSFQ